MGSEGEFKKRISPHDINMDIYTDEVMQIIAAAKKEFPEQNGDEFDYIESVNKWYAKWFGEA